MADTQEENPVAVALQRLRARLEVGEDLGSVEINFDELEPRDADAEWDAWERAIMARAFED